MKLKGRIKWAWVITLPVILVVVFTVVVGLERRPRLSLFGEPSIILNYNQAYEDPGVDVFPQTAKVKVTNPLNVQVLGTYTEVYSASWLFFRTEVKRTIEVRDLEAPQLSLAGSPKIYLTRGQAYQEPGYSAVDQVDGDLSAQVTIDNPVDVHVDGTYTITYHVQDQAGNQQQAQRVVIVREPITPQSGVIYLTFDDGPSNLTAEFLDVLRDENVKATFFVTGRGSDDMLSREAAEGHTIGLHTMTHNYAQVYKSAESYYADLQAIHDRVLRVTGKDSKIIRFPGGSSNTISANYSPHIMTFLAQDVQAKGYTYFDWNVSSGDGDSGKLSPQALYDAVVNNLNINRENVVLMHDTNHNTLKALHNIIEYGKNNGYQFRAIDSSTPPIHHPINN